MLKGREYLAAKLNTVRSRALTRYEYYEMKNSHEGPHIAIPWRLAQPYKAKLGWCTKAVDLLADRLVVSGFKNDDFDMQSLYDANNSDILFDSAILGALITSCDFIYLYKENGEVGMQVIDGTNATGILDRTTNLLTEGYAVLERDPETKAVLVDAYFTKDKTVYRDMVKQMEYSIPHNAGQPLLVPIINRPDSKREFGHSRISRVAMRAQDQAEDVLTAINVTSEINSWPQKYILGLSETAEGIDSIKATVSSMLRFDKDEDGDRPTVGQFSQMSMDGPLKHFDTFLSDFCGEVSLTRDDLGYVSSNPSSAEAIKASHESLRVTAAKAQRSFGTGFVNAGYVGVCLREDFPLKRSEVCQTSVIWRPIVEPDASTLSSIGDGAIKLNQAVPNFLTAESLSNITGIDYAPQSETETDLNAILGINE